MDQTPTIRLMINTKGRQKSNKIEDLEQHIEER